MKKYFLIILILAILTGGIYLPRSFGSEKELLLHIEGGDGSDEISQSLEKNGLIWPGPFFRIYVLLSGDRGKLQAGSYFLSSSMNIPQIAQKIAAGDIAKAAITIPEGFTSQQISERLKDITEMDTTILSSYEGYLFPDTYEMPYGASTQDIIKIMTDNFIRQTTGLEITPGAVIMASILEREVKTKEEKELVAGVLWKRLKAGIHLQVDVAPWTYKNYGLPSQPISNPGLDSILAALYPKDSPYWYYLSKPDGVTVFSKTLAEHNIAKAKYLLR